MQIFLGNRSVFVILMLCMCLLSTYGKGGKIIINTRGRGRGGKGRYRGSLYSRSNNRGSSTRYRHGQSQTKNLHRSASEPLSYDDAVKKIDYSPTFKELNPNYESLRYLPNSKPRSSLHSGPPPPYSYDGQSALNAPGESHLLYKLKQPSVPVEKPPPYSFPGQRSPNIQQPGIQPPPYPKEAGQPSSHLGQPPPPYPGLSTFSQSGHSNQYAVYPLALGSQQYLSQHRENTAHHAQSRYSGSHQQKLGGILPYSATYPEHSGNKNSKCKDENFLKRVINKFDYCDIETTSITGYLSIEKCCQLLVLNGVI